MNRAACLALVAFAAILLGHSVTAAAQQDEVQVDVIQPFQAGPGAQWVQLRTSPIALPPPPANADPGGDDGADVDADADDPAAGAIDPATVPDGPLRHRVHLLDGSILTGRILTDAMSVKTAYGKLTVPSGDILRIVPGLDHQPAMRKEVMDLIEDLGADDANARDKAQQALTDMGPKIILLLQARRNDDDVERARRVATVIEALEQMRDDQMLDPLGGERFDMLIREDRVETRSFTIIGRLQDTKVDIDTNFGKLGVELTKIERIEVVRPGPSIVRKRLSVQGSNMAMVNHVQTGIRLKRGDRVSIKASGKITMSPWGSNAFSVPDGMSNYGHYMNGIPMGALVGRVGNTGSVFIIGSKKQFVADKSGQLELGFAMQPNYGNQQFPGSYDVQIRVTPRK